MCQICPILSNLLKKSYMKQLLGMAIAVALGVIIAGLINKQLSKSTTTTA